MQEQQKKYDQPLPNDAVEKIYKAWKSATGLAPSPLVEENRDTG